MNEKHYVYYRYGGLAIIRASSPEEAQRISGSGFEMAVCNSQHEACETIRQIMGTPLQDGEVLPIPCVQ